MSVANKHAVLRGKEIYPKSLEWHGGGKGMRPHELSLLSDWGE
jgi:hypothetical protein